MNKNKAIKKNTSKPIENHETAAWADIEKTMPESKVPIPSEKAVVEAKEWVDKNHK